MLKTIQRPKVELQKNGHVYFVDGRETAWPSVTQVLDEVIDKPWAAYWAKNQSLSLVKEELFKLKEKDIKITEDLIDALIKAGRAKPDQAKKEGADKGTAFHDLAVKILAQKSFDIPKDMEQAAYGFRDFLDRKKVKLLLAEQAVASIDHEYVGQFDSIVETADGIELWDFKTANKNSKNEFYPGTGVYNKDGYQLGAYALAIKETLGHSVFKGRIIWINKNDIEWADFEIRDLTFATRGFIQALQWFKFNRTKILSLKEKFSFSI